MDLDTENLLLVEETRKLRLQDDKEAVQAVSPKPGVTQCPNSRFLSATVVGIQQTNQIVEVDEMWHAKEKEIEMDFKMKCKTNDHIGLSCKRQIITSRSLASVRKTEKDGQLCATSFSVRHSRSISCSDSEDGLEDDELEEYDKMWHAKEKEVETGFKTNRRNNDHTGLRCKKHNVISPVSKIKQDSKSWVTSSPVKYSRNVSYSDSEDELSDDELEEFLHPRLKRGRVSYSDSEDELSDDELEEFLRPRVKRGRGTSGSRMDEAGPDRTTPSGRKNKLPGSDILQVKGEREHQVQSPGKPIFFRSAYDCPSKRSITYDPCRGERSRNITYEPCRGERSRSITYEPCRGERIRSITYDPCLRLENDR